MTRASKCDRRALAVAQTIEKIAAPIDIFLFGSRARGDWHDASDIDIFTIAERDATTAERYRRALEAGRARARRLYGAPVKIDLVMCSPEEFDYYRQARTHLTYAAFEDGIHMNRDPVGYNDPYGKIAPNNWPDVARRFTNYQRQVRSAKLLLEEGMGYEEVGHFLQRCLENAFKGLLAYLEYDDGEQNAWRRTHSLTVLQKGIRTFSTGRQILGDKDFSFLNDRGIHLPYEGVGHPLPDEAGVLASIQETVEAVMQFVENDLREDGRGEKEDGRGLF